MAVPFRRTGKTAKRKRRTHYKLTAPCLVIDENTGEFTLPHHVTKNCGYYKGKKVLFEKEKTQAAATTAKPEPKEKTAKFATEKKANKEAVKKPQVKSQKAPSVKNKTVSGGK